MTMRLRPPNSLLDEITLSVQQHGRPLYALFTTYTFSASMFTSQFLPILCGEFAEDNQRVGLLVVCDARSYSGHRLGPWVTTWPGTELFHPKVALLIFQEVTLLFAGSGNLTDSGQYCQIEVLGKKSWDRRGLPEELVPLVSRLDGPLSKALLRLDRLQSRSFACSLGTNFAKRLKRGRIDEILVVSPFFDAHESGEPDDLGFVAGLVKYHAPKTVRLVIPVEESTSKNRAAKVQINPEILKSIGKPLRLYGVDPNNGGRRLHAKLIALYRKDRVRLLFGSANATMAGMTRKNVEAGWFIDSTRSEIAQWLHGQKLFDCPLDPNDVQFEGVSRKTPIALRSPLQCARLDQIEETLTLVWRSHTDAARTEVIYGAKSLCPRKNIVHGFHIGNDWFVRTRTAGQRPFSFAPIELTRELPGARRVEDSSDTNAESLLDRLVAAPDLDSPLSTGTRRRAHEDTRQIANCERSLYDRIRKLAGAMATARRQLEDELPQRMATLALLVRIARASDPAPARLSHREALWRYWVRIEVARVIASSPRTTAIVEAREKLYNLLKTHKLPLCIRDTARMVRREVAL